MRPRRASGVVLLSFFGVLTTWLAQNLGLERADEAPVQARLPPEDPAHPDTKLPPLRASDFSYAFFVPGHVPGEPDDFDVRVLTMRDRVLVKKKAGTRKTKGAFVGPGPAARYPAPRIDPAPGAPITPLVMTDPAMLVMPPQP